MSRGKLTSSVLCVLFSVLAVGCINVSYTGASYPANPEKVKLFNSKDQVKQTYTVMGKAKVTAPYKYSTEEMKDKLTAKAKEEGADGVIITSYSVVPEEECREDQALGVATASAASHDSDTNSSGNIQTAHDNFDHNYGQIGKEPNSSRTVSTYKRIINAEFIKFTNANSAVVPKETSKNK